MYNRLGLNDTFLIFPMAVTFYFWVKGLNNPLALFGAGISSFACYITKASALYFIVLVFSCSRVLVINAGKTAFMKKVGIAKGNSKKLLAKP